MRELAGSSDAALLVGLAPFDDAAVYRVSDDVALVSTTDFFPPLVDDPADFGAIAAANACSDVFAMGGRVVLAVNVAAFPEHFPARRSRPIFERRGRTVVAEAGGTVAGGHTIRNPEPIFGLAVQGVVHPDRVFRKSGAAPGDVLVLSKPIGTGIVLAGGSRRRQGGGDRRHAHAQPGGGRGAAGAGRRRSTRSPTSPATASPGTAGRWPSARDARASSTPTALPFYAGALAAAERGVRTGGDQRNRDYLAGHLDSATAPDALEALCFDPQTSGGLLAAVAPEPWRRAGRQPARGGRRGRGRRARRRLA